MGLRKQKPEADPLDAPLRHEFYGTPACNGGRRDLGDVSLVVVHQAQNSGLFGSARSCAAYLRGRPDGSAHESVDSWEGYGIAPASLICCGVAGYNSSTYHIEQAGWSTWRKATWFLPQNRRQMDRVAWRVAHGLRKFSLPNRFRTAKDLRAGRTRGWTTHRELTKAGAAIGVTSTHTDPGAGWAKRYSIRKVSEFCEEGRGE